MRATIPNRKQVLELFEQGLLEDYRAYCRSFNLVPDLHGFITYVVDQEFIPPATMARFAILREYERQLQEPQKIKKSELIEHLAERFNLSTRTVWNILRATSGAET